MMKIRISLFALLFAPVLAGYTDQSPLTYADSIQEDPSEHYKFSRPIRRVAVIGAGVAGLIAYRELVEAGLDVHLYERDYVPGGNWHYTEETPVFTPIPILDIALGDYIPSLPPKGAVLPYSEEYHGVDENAYRKRAHRAPKPIWNSLTSNVPAPVQQIRELPWPSGTPWALPRKLVQGYLRAFASYHGLNSNDDNTNVSYNTRVELVEKRYDDHNKEAGWILTVKSLTNTKRDSLKATWRQEHFDAVVVATGRYNAPNVPNIEGLKEWADRFPAQVLHARAYRRPELYTNKTVLIVGAATSGAQISRDINSHAKKVYQSIRPDNSPISQQTYFLSQLPRNVTVVPEVKRFLPVTAKFSEGRIELVNGTIITGLDHIIFATGYKYTYPFLPQYHNASLGVNTTAPVEGVQPIVTDGTHLRSLYLDAFYIPDPTLAFVNANLGIQAFTYAEFVSLAIAKVWSGTADFPAKEELWRRYYKLYAERKGYGKHFQFLGNDKARYNMRLFQGWLSDAAIKYGGKQINSLSDDVAQVGALWAQALFSSTSPVKSLHTPTSSSFGTNDQVVMQNVLNETVTGHESWVQDLVYNDYW